MQQAVEQNNSKYSSPGGQDSYILSARAFCVYGIAPKSPADHENIFVLPGTVVPFFTTQTNESNIKEIA